MSKKDFELIARTVNNLRQYGFTESGSINRNIVDGVADEFADALATTNPRFDRNRFLRVCGVGS